LNLIFAANDILGLTAVARRAAADKTQIAVRNELAKFTADTFTHVGEELYAVAHVFGPGQIIRLSPSRHGIDQIDAVSLLFRIAGQLTSASASLVGHGMHYAAAALVRQIVEVEYLAWAFQSCDKDAERWLRSSADERRNFFTPAKLRRAANGKFRGKDYGYHCELGGHPVPGSLIFFPDNLGASQLLLSDLLGHTGRIWDHFLDWSADDEWTLPIYSRREEMFLKYDAWKKADELTLLPPPP
jgi:hypothetical protein